MLLGALVALGHAGRQGELHLSRPIADGQRSPRLREPACSVVGHAEEMCHLVIHLQGLERCRVASRLPIEKALRLPHDGFGKGPGQGMPKELPDHISIPLQQRRAKSVEVGEQVKLRFCCK